MKKVIILICICITSFFFSQEKLKLNNISAGIGIFYISKEAYQESEQENGGFSAFVDIGSSYKNNLFSLQYTDATEFSILGSSDFKVKEINLMYGRRDDLSNWFAVEGYIGLGLFFQKNSYYNENTVSLPLKIKLILFPKNVVNFGINGNYTVNKINNNLSAHLFLNFNLKK